MKTITFKNEDGKVTVASGEETATHPQEVGEGQWPGACGMKPETPMSETTYLDRLIAEASVLAGGMHPCDVLGHRWRFSGGAGCGCEGGSCSVPVHDCEVCGDCDYGENGEASETRRVCAEERQHVGV